MFFNISGSISFHCACEHFMCVYFSFLSPLCWCYYITSNWYLAKSYVLTSNKKSERLFRRIKCLNLSKHFRTNTLFHPQHLRSAYFIHNTTVKLIFIRCECKYPSKYATYHINITVFICYANHPRFFLSFRQCRRIFCTICDYTFQISYSTHYNFMTQQIFIKVFSPHSDVLFGGGNGGDWWLSGAERIKKISNEI